MNIINQIRVSLVLSLVLAVAISASIIVTYQNMQELQHQENLAADVVRGGYELNYLTDDYLINAGPRARDQWEERYASLQPIISQLKASNQEEEHSIEAIRDYNAKIGQMFREIPGPGELSTGAVLFQSGFQQVTWSRNIVQSQGLIFEAWRLRHLYNNNVSDARFWNNILVLALILAIIAIISVNYLLISRRLIQSINEVNAGSEEFARGNLEYRIPVTARDEMGEIAGGLNRMASQIRSVTASRDELNREIGVRKQAEEALMKSQIQLAEAMDLASLVNWEFDVASGIFTFDDRFYTLYGTNAELEGGNLMPADVYAKKFVHPDDQYLVADEVNKAIKATDPGYLSQVEHRIIRRDGEIRYIVVRFGITKDEIGRTIKTHGANQDITERKQSEIARDLLLKELEQKNAELDRFTYTVSHDLKSPLITIQGFVSFLGQDLQKNDTEKVKTDLQRITSATGKMERLISTLLELSRSGKSVDTPEHISFTGLVQEAAGLLDVSLKNHGVKLTVGDDLPVVSGDRQRLVQVMTNLLENAVKFMGDQKVPVVEVGVRNQDTGPVFFVRDNGIGIRNEDQPKIFGLFERLHPEIPGTGIGLATVKRIIEAHGGKIWVESEGTGKGTTFWFTLPGNTNDRNSGTGH